MNNEERPPYVVFETIQIEDRAKTMLEGHFVEKDQHVANITRPGQRDTLIKDAPTWLKELENLAKAGQIPQSWPSHFKGMYQTWLSGAEGTVNGTPIKGWAPIGNALQKLLINAGITTVEDLANIPDNEVGLIGTGALATKQKAVNWLAASRDTGKMVEQMAAMQAQMASLLAVSQEQAEELKKYRSAEGAKKTGV